MISLHVTYFGVVLRPPLKIRHPLSYTVRTAKITGMLRWTALILWMSSESTADGLTIPTYLIVGSCYSLLFAILTSYTTYIVIPDGWSS